MRFNTMKLPLFLIIYLTTLSALAQKFTFPKLSAQSDKIEKVIPKNWHVLDSAKGNLNNDHFADYALILEYKEPVSENRAYGDYEIELINEFQKPRILAIYFKTKTGYKLSIQNNDFVLREKEGAAMGDPLKNLRIEDKKLTISFEGGNDWRWKLNYEFTFQHNDWNLTNANNVYYHKDSGDMIDKQYNFVDRTITTVAGSIFRRNIANKSEEDILFFGSPRTLSNFKKPWTWEISKDNYL